MINHNGKTYYPDDNGWYPIECAPKDGTECLLVEPPSFYSPDYSIVIGWYGEDYNDTEGISEWLYGTGDDYSIGHYYNPIRPTHWQPLPKPPVTQEVPNEVPQ